MLIFRTTTSSSFKPLASIQRGSRNSSQKVQKCNKLYFIIFDIPKYQEFWLLFLVEKYYILKGFNINQITHSQKIFDRQRVQLHEMKNHRLGLKKNFNYILICQRFFISLNVNMMFHYCLMINKRKRIIRTKTLVFAFFKIKDHEEVPC